MKIIPFHIIFVCIWAGLITQQAHAQDAQFSQAYASPLTLNPAMSGLFDGGYRVSMNYRDQWRSTVQNPLKTYSVGGELQFNVNEKSQKNPDIVSAGLMFFTDRVRFFDLNTTQMALSLAYHKALDKKYGQYLGIGLQMGVVQKNINYEDLNFGDEFNGINEYDLITGESLPGNNIGFGDFAIGLHYSISPNDHLRVFAGLAMHHLLTPQISFFNRVDFVAPGQIVDNPLKRKLSFQLSMDYSMSPGMNFLPRLLFFQQGTHQQALLGPVFKFNMLKTEATSFQAGFLARVTSDYDTTAINSSVLMFGVNLNKLAIGLSYDLNLRNAVNELNAPGTFELSIRFTGEYDNTVNYCPSF